VTVLDGIRRPEYTGRNRCWPCTVVNAGILGVAAVVAGVAWPPLGVAVAVVGTAAIWIRGYLVPYTPQFAPRLAEYLPVGFTGSSAAASVPEGQSGSLSGTDPSDPEAVLETLLEGGVLVAEGEDLLLSPAFEDAWRREWDRLRDATDEDLAAAVAGAAPGDPAVTTHEVDGGTWVRLAGEGEGEVFLSRPVAVAEAAAVRALDALDAGTDPETSATAARALRAFLDTCPVCETALVESSTADCCGGRTANPRPVSLCPECGHSLYTFPET